MAFRGFGGNQVGFRRFGGPGSGDQDLGETAVLQRRPRPDFANEALSDTEYSDRVGARNREDATRQAEDHETTAWRQQDAANVREADAQRQAIYDRAKAQERSAAADVAAVSRPAPPAASPVSVAQLQDAYAKFLSTAQATPAPQAPPQAQAQPSMDTSGITSLIQKMTDDRLQDRGRQDAERAAMRALLMRRIGDASKPVDATDPGIRGQLASQRLARQRSAERQRSQAAVRLAGEGLSDSGALDTTLAGIEEMRGAGESSDIAEVMGREHQAKRHELMQLYQMALAQGDSEAARQIQQELAALSASVAGAQITEGGRQFDTSQQSNRQQFTSNLALQLMLAQLRSGT